MAHHAIVHPIVAMNNARPLLWGSGGDESVVKFLEERHLAIGAFIDLALPSTELPRAVVLFAPQVAESDFVRVERVERGECVGERIRHRGT